MTIAVWLLPALFALVVWGISAFLPKLAVRTLSPLPQIVYSNFAYLIFATLALAVHGFRLESDPMGVLLAVATGIFGAMAQVLYIFAIRNGPMSSVTVVTSLYPVASTLLAFLILDERLTSRQAAGIILGIFSLILMVVAHDDKVQE